MYFSKGFQEAVLVNALVELLFQAVNNGGEISLMWSLPLFHTVLFRVSTISKQKDNDISVRVDHARASQVPTMAEEPYVYGCPVLLAP